MALLVTTDIAVQLETTLPIPFLFACATLPEMSSRFVRRKVLRYSKAFGLAIFQ